METLKPQTRDEEHNLGPALEVAGQLVRGNATPPPHPPPRKHAKKSKK